MPRICFTGSDKGAGRQIEGVTYFPGDVVDLSPYWARVLVAQGLAVPAAPPAAPARMTAEVEVEHRDEAPKARKRRTRRKS